MVFSVLSQSDADRMRRRKITRKGFKLTVMVCGRAGTGKSTFINTLCDNEVYTDDSTSTSTRQLTIGSKQIDLGEADGTVINLTVIDTPGFAESIDSSKDPATIKKYLEDQFEDILREEALICRNPRFEDKRVHVCLYFLPPTGHKLREFDIDAMITLSSRVNIIPVIGKADTMTDSELIEAKQTIMDSIRSYNIPIFTFNYDFEDEESIEENTALREILPFAMVGSQDIYQVGDRYIRARQYPWGIVEVEDPLHSDFVALRGVLLGSHIQELRDTTNEILYEKYRTERLYKDPELLQKIREEEATKSGHFPAKPTNIVSYIS